MYQIGQKVWTGVFVCGEWQRMAAGIVIEIHSGYYSVDIMSLHGGKPWIVDCVYLEKYEDKKPIRIKDLPDNKSLDGVMFLHPETKEKCIWASQWEKGIFYRKDDSSTRIYTLFVEKLEEALEFELA